MTIDTVTQAKIRDFSCAMNESALTLDELKAIAYDYLNKVMRGTNVITAWDKETKLLMASMGVAQNKTTGFPERYDGSVQAWKINYEMERDKLLKAVCVIDHLTGGIIKAVEEEEGSGNTGMCDRQACGDFIDQIKSLIEFDTSGIITYDN